MWSDVPYPLSISVMTQMLDVKLTVPKDMVGNDMIHVEQLVQIIRKNLHDRQAMATKFKIR
jgi:hypothetical protein